VGLEELFTNEHASLSDEEALVEAERCLNCGGPRTPPPCVTSCPVGLDVPRFINEIREQRPLDAATTIFASNPLGATCARVCPSGDLCECACALARVGREPVRIAMLQRYATEAWLESKPSKRPDGLTSPTHPLAGSSSHALNVAVIGAGPAGLSCAAELARLGHRVTIYEHRRFPGGLVTAAIAAYKQRYEPIPQEVEAITALGVDLRLGECIDATRFRAIEAEHDAVFLGIGLGPDRLGELPGEDLKDVWNSLAFIERVKRGVISDLTDRRVVVIGGGNAAVEVARAAMMLGAEDVLVMYGRSDQHMSASRHDILAARAEGVRFLFQTTPVRLIGGWNVKAVECVRTGSEDRSIFLLEADLVVKATGQRPQDALLDEFGIEQRDGLVSVDEHFRTSDPRCFAGGDCVNGGATVVQAVQHGRRAAHAIHIQYAGDEAESPTMHAGRWRPGTHDHVPIGVQRMNGIVRHYQGDFALFTWPHFCKACPDCVRNCPIGGLELDEHDRVRVLDIGQCIFCGLCEANCPEGAIWMERPDAAPINA
jgi:dihydropyrimidine dehydrogenase (NAD+) subunit PreT